MSTTMAALGSSILPSGDYLVKSLKSLNLNLFRSFDIIASIENLRARGMEFLNIPDSYYNVLRKRLAKSPVKVTFL